MNHTAKTCTFPDCGRTPKCQGLCSSHYEQHRRGRPLTPLRRVLKNPAFRDDQGRKECTRCGYWLDPGLFSQMPQSQDGLTPACTRCQALGKYGLNRATYEALRARQGGGCAICGGQSTDGPSLHVDHDHSCCPGSRTCGKCIRGLLCNGCNIAIGYMRDDPARLRAAADYLDR